MPPSSGQYPHRRLALPGCYRDANFNFAHLKRFAQTLGQAFAQASDCAG
ncbi:hypothetical protein J2Y88_000649 [Pseudomonas chlororaphis]|nr:hypothetical protein [Pseudomonas chlororaphis]MCP1478338.1 hypothetical protein [Pseudomonas chlororaphis]MCP1595310.1 hypothetical protein [Pseudomonas chlororaphis]